VAARARLNDSECGQMGVNRMAGTLGWTMEPPAATEYAVLPVGVASMTPSACTCPARQPRSRRRRAGTLQEPCALSNFCTSGFNVRWHSLHGLDA
jgi:hypothetical protein